MKLKTDQKQQYSSACVHQQSVQSAENKYVLRCSLIDDFTSAGSEFQTFGAEFWNDLYPYLTLFVSSADDNLRNTWRSDLKDLEGV